MNEKQYTKVIDLLMAQIERLEAQIAEIKETAELKEKLKKAQERYQYQTSQANALGPQINPYSSIQG